MNWRRGLVWLILTISWVIGAYAIYQPQEKKTVELTKEEVMQIPITDLADLEFEELIEITNQFEFEKL